MTIDKRTLQNITAVQSIDDVKRYLHEMSRVLDVTIAQLLNGDFGTKNGGEEGVTVHGDLDGLTADDHQHYTLADGSRPFVNPVGGMPPTADSHLTTKLYVDDNSGGTNDHQALINRDALDAHDQYAVTSHLHFHKDIQNPDEQDDHTQYHNDTRGDSRYYREDEHIQLIATPNSPLITDGTGKVNAALLPDGGGGGAEVASTHLGLWSKIADAGVPIAAQWSRDNATVASVTLIQIHTTAIEPNFTEAVMEAFLIEFGANDMLVFSSSEGDRRENYRVVSRPTVAANVISVVVDQGTVLGTALNLESTTLTVHSFGMKRTLNLADIDSTAAGRLNMGLGRAGGFENRASSSIITIPASRIGGITPTGGAFLYWVDNVRFAEAGTVSIAWPDTDGWHGLYFDEAGVIQVSSVGSAYEKFKRTYILYVYWNVSRQQQVRFLDGRQTTDQVPQARLLQEVQDVLVLYLEGFDITMAVRGQGPTGNNDTDLHIGFTDGRLEWPGFTINIMDGAPQTIGAIAQLPILILEGTRDNPVWYYEEATDIPFMHGGRGAAPGLRASYNPLSGINYVLLECPNDYFFYFHIIAGAEDTEPMAVVMGRMAFADQALCETDARQHAVELKEGRLNFHKLLYTIVGQTRDVYSNNGKSVYEGILTETIPFVSTPQNFDWREKRLSDDYGAYYSSAQHVVQSVGAIDAGKPALLGLGGKFHSTVIPAVSAGSHGNLLDLQVLADHLLYSAVDGSRAFTAPVGGEQATLGTHLARLDQVSIPGHPHVEIDITDLDRARWLDTWQPLLYAKNDMVLDGEWTMIANKATEDRAAPQPTGEPFYPSGYADPPPWVTPTNSAVQTLTGQRYTFLSAGYFLGYRIWIPEVNSLVSYSIWVVEDLGGANPIYTPIAAELQPTTVGWLNIFTGTKIIAAGTVRSIVVVHRSEVAGSSTVANYSYVRANQNTPASGEFVHRNNGSDVRIHYIDSDSTDRTAALQDLEAGNTITAEGIDWTITSTTDQGVYISMVLTPSVRIGSEGTYSFTFAAPSDTPIQHVEITDHYLGDANIEGLIAIAGGVDDIIFNQDGYGIDILLQNVIASPDWDIVALSGATGGGGGGGDDVDHTVFMTKAADLSDVVNTQNARFNIGLGPNSGFEDIVDSTFVIDTVLREFRLAPTDTAFFFWVDSVRFVKLTTPDEVVVWPNTEGFHFFFYDAAGTLVTSQSIDTTQFKATTQVAVIYWSVIDQVIVRYTDERKPLELDPSSRLNFRGVILATILSGGTPSNLSPDGTGTVETDLHIGMTGIEFLSQDRVFQLVSGDTDDVYAPIGLFTINFKLGSEIRRSNATAIPVLYGGRSGAPGTRLAFNEFGIQLTEAASGNYVWYHMMCNGDEQYPYFLYPGLLQHTTKQGAQDLLDNEIEQLMLYPLMPNTFLLASFLYQTDDSYTNTAKSRLVTLVGDVSTHQSWVGSARGTRPPASLIGDHGALAGRDDDEDHLQYALVAGTRAFTGKVQGVTTIGADNGFTLTTKDYVDTFSPGIHDHDGIYVPISHITIDSDPHSMYHNDARGDARYTPIAHETPGGDPHNADYYTQAVLWTQAEHLATSGGQVDAGLPVKLDGIGKFDVSLMRKLNPSDFYFEEFYYFNNQAWNQTISGTAFGGTDNINGLGWPNKNDIDGILRLSTGTTPASDSIVTQQSTRSVNFGTDGRWLMIRTLIQDPTAIIRWGFTDNITGPGKPTNGVYFEMDPIVDTNIYAITRANGVETKNLMLAYSIIGRIPTNWGIVRSGAGYIFYLNNSAVTTSSTNIPDSTAVQAKVFFQLQGISTNYFRLLIDSMAIGKTDAKNSWRIPGT